MASRPLLTAPSVTPVAQVAVGDADVAVGQARYDQAHYDVYPEATYSGVDALFSDTSCTVIEAHSYSGRQRAFERFDIGTVTLTVANDDGAWDYPPADGTDNPLTLRPGRQIRVGVVIAGVPAPLWLWRGWIDATRPDYRPGVGDVVTVEAVDAKGEAGRTEVGRLTAAVGAGETATARVARIADYAVVPAHRRLFDDTGITLLGTQLGGRATNLFDAAADSSGGAVFGDANGFLVYRHRDWLSWPAAATADVSIGNRPGDTACPSEWEIAFARADFATRVVYGRSGEDPYTIDDAINQARYGVETYTVNNLETATLATLHELGQRLARARSFDRAPRVAAVTLNAADPGARDVMAAVSPFLPTLASVGLVEDDGRTVFTRMAYVTAVEHTITAQAWTARIALDDAWPYMQQSDARYDVALYDVDRYARAV